jgi:chemotaxis signal transduction protein
MESGPYLLFQVGMQRYLIELGAVAEIAPAARPRLIPCVPVELAGVVNVRGEPVPVVDGGAVLQGSRVPPYSHVLLLEGRGGRVGMLVAGVSRIERGRPTLPEERDEEDKEAPFVQRALLRDGEVGVVDVEGLFARARELLRGALLRKGGTACQSAF